MSLGSMEYRNLKRRLDELRGHLLYFVPSPPISSTFYSPQELDSTRAYVVLAHAEIEAFCEALVLKKVIAAKTLYDNSGDLRPSLRRLISYHVAKKGTSWHKALTPAPDVVQEACESFSSVVRDNHGIKRKNLGKLLFPIGVLEPNIDATWLANMDSFGATRGVWAHNSIRTQQPPDPLTQLNAVSLLLQGLLQLDKALRRIR